MIYTLCKDINILFMNIKSNLYSKSVKLKAFFDINETIDRPSLEQ